MQHEASRTSFKTAARITGVEARTPEGTVEIHADLVVGCDGRQATTRQVAHLEVIESGVPIDVLWFRISRNTDDPEQLFGNINYGKALILINRGDYFQSGLIIRKGSFEEMKRHGLGAFRRSILQIAPYIGHRVEELKDWDQIKLLTVQINRLRQWSRPGLLCIGDAAHAMSPAGGVGINLAIQDAVATANLLGRRVARRAGHRSAGRPRTKAARVSDPRHASRAGECAQGIRIHIPPSRPNSCAVADEACVSNTGNPAPDRAVHWHRRSPGAHPRRKENEENRCGPVAAPRRRFCGRLRRGHGTLLPGHAASIGRNYGLILKAAGSGPMRTAKEESK